MTMGLPVKGYVDQTTVNIELVNENKVDEERILRKMDDLAEHANVDKRWLAIARTDIEKGFMALNRAIFKPQRVKLDDDDA